MSASPPIASIWPARQNQREGHSSQLRTVRVDASARVATPATSHTLNEDISDSAALRGTALTVMKCPRGRHEPVVEIVPHLAPPTAICRAPLAQINQPIAVDTPRDHPMPLHACALVISDRRAPPPATVGPPSAAESNGHYDKGRAAADRHPSHTPTRRKRQARRAGEESKMSAIADADLLKRLQEWYVSQCKNDWEHTYGISLSTLDNPGWSLNIDLTDTYLCDRRFAEVRLDGLDKNDWYICKVENHVFKACSGPERLSDVIAVFLEWAYRY